MPHSLAEKLSGLFKLVNGLMRLERSNVVSTTDLVVANKLGVNYQELRQLQSILHRSTSIGCNRDSRPGRSRYIMRANYDVVAAMAKRGNPGPSEAAQ